MAVTFVTPKAKIGYAYMESRGVRTRPSKAGLAFYPIMSCYLNDEHDIVGDRVGPRIEIVPRFEKGYIGKGFGVFIDMNRVRMLTIIRFRSKLLRISPAFLTQAACGCRSGTFR